MTVHTIDIYRQRPSYSNRITGGLNTIEKKLKQEIENDIPLVSIVTVVFNGENCLEPTIKSVVEQSYKNIEYIVIDGGSTDETLNIIRNYENYIDLWISEPDEGLYDAINKGISLCRGNIIGIIHAGDIYTDDAVLSTVEAYTKSETDIIITGNCQMTLSDPTKWMIISPNREIFPYKTIPHPSTFVPLAVYQKYGLFDTSFKIAGDYEFFCRCYKQGISIFHVDKVLAIVSPPGISKNYYLAEVEQIRVRLYHRLNFFMTITLGLYSFLTITIHILLEYINLWHLIEDKRHGKLYK